MSEFYVRAFGAAGDGETNDTKAIQEAVDACSKEGGTVVVSPGTYRIGTLVLKSGVHLYLAEGAVLLGSRQLEDYRDDIGCFIDGIGQKRGISLIYTGEGVERVKISGRGTIDGQGEWFRKDKGYTGVRPFLVRFVQASQVTLHDITLKNAAAWVVHFHECRKVDVSNVTIRSRVNSNNDGLDIDSCSGVSIRNCDIDTGDDAIVLKSTTPAACEDVTVQGCRLRSNWAGVKFGTESYGGFRRIKVTDCYIYDTNGCGIKLLTVDGADLEDVEFSGITMDQVAGPIFMRLGSRLRTYDPGQEQKTAGRLRDVVLRHIKATVKENPDRKSAVCLSGIPGCPIENIRMEHMELTFPGGLQEEVDLQTIPELEAAYPEFYMFGTSPAAGLFLRHVNGIVLNKIVLKTLKPDVRPAVAAVDVTGLQLFDIRTEEQSGIGE